MGNNSFAGALRLVKLELDQSSHARKSCCCLRYCPCSVIAPVLELCSPASVGLGVARARTCPHLAQARI
eukprot:10735362-Alexandrium_andersonii.AAC.1